MTFIRKALVVAMSYLPYSVLDAIGSRTQAFSQRWHLVSVAWFRRDRRRGK